MPLTSESVKVAPITETALPYGSERILFVDDEKDITVWAEELLTQHGFKAVSRTSSKDALTLLQSDPQAFDLLITDQSMPEISGLELVAEAQKMRPDLPVILCTGFSSLVTPEVARQQGVNGFFHKPYREAELLNTIRDCLDGQQ